MHARKTEEFAAGAPHVVGTVHSPEALRHALRLKPGAVDLLELRVDHFADDPRALLRALPRLLTPYLVTVRHPAEGGAGKLSPARRRELLREFLPQAAGVDLELRTVLKPGPLLALVQEAGTPLIVSDHHFTRTPPLALLQERAAQAMALQPVVVKVAALTRTAEEVARLLQLLGGMKRQAGSVMGMGPLGKASRLLFARAGSVLNYGYLGQPQVSGQWPGPRLKERLAEVLGEE